MKLYTILFILCLPAVCFNQSLKWDDWMPLHPENKWQYLTTGYYAPHGALNYLHSLSIVNTIKKDSIIYYELSSGEVVRYDKEKQILFNENGYPELDFSKHDGETFLYYTILEKTAELFDSLREFKGFYSSSSSINSSSTIWYTRGIGEGFSSSFTAGGGMYGSSDTELIQAIIHDSLGTKIYSHNYFPKLSNISAKLDSINKFEVSLKVTHFYSNKDFSFIDTVLIYSFYKKNSDTVFNAPTPIFSEDSIYTTITRLDYNLLSGGYVYFYKFAAKDKSMIPKYSYAPEKEYYHISITDVANPVVIAKNYSLNQNYPNPFNSTTTINYSIPSRTNSVIKVFDILGNEIASISLESTNGDTGNIIFDASKYDLVSGVYFCQLISSFGTRSIKMIYLK